MTALIVAVTGGIGAGKSTVSAGLAARGGVVIDADRLARDVVAPGTTGLTAVTEAFGRGVLTPDGSLDRGALGRIVFADPAALVRLEAITHPLVRALAAERIAAVPADAIAVNDIPLIRAMPEAARYHLVIGVGVADEEIRVRRLIARGHTEPDARSRIAAQISDVERRRLADVWIDNSGPVQDLEQAIDALWTRVTTFAAQRRAGAPAAHRTSPDVRGMTELEATAMTAARVSAACGGRAPELSTASVDGALSMTVLLDDPADLDRFRPVLADAGFPPIAAGHQGAVWRFGSADPGRNLNLYLRVRDRSAGRDPGD
ncbi:dephospho-CoA kinase [Nakamurella lactea]|uniref:dephospho-CoA kinase n=1 Tax=Nakamurella lactea TaxID=459515 RepID=UPI001378EF21|nr:dephospho-CoA kinase [Nakamurella lactea]